MALAKGDLATAKAEAKTRADGAAARQNSFRVRQAHALAGTIALKEKRFDAAIARLGRATSRIRR
ncbi:MAG: hypothetical protein ACREOF_21440 [Gemmatimonadales bacterium]